MTALRYAHLCDYASADAKSKPTIVGVFDIIFDVQKKRPIQLPPVAHFVAKMECSIGDGSMHTLQIVVRHEDGEVVHQVNLGPLEFRPTGPGRPLSAQIIMMIGGMPFPELGDYAFEMVVDGTKIGETPLYLADAPPALHG